MRAMLWEMLQGDDVRCLLCPHACTIKKGKRGRCGVRGNAGGKLVSMVSNVVTSGQVDSVEKKPLFHFLPGSRTFSVGSAGCNFHCIFCQNHLISDLPESGVVPGKRTSPDALASLAVHSRTPSMSFTYNEPTVFFELLYETAGLVKEQGMRVALVSNGFMSGGFLQSMAKRVDAINVDLKSFSDSFYRERCGGRIQPVLDNLMAIRKLGWWLEVTTLVIPGCNDSSQELRDIAQFIRNELGADTPWHVTAFQPAHHMSSHPATSPQLLEQCWHIGRENGLNFVYMGNITTSLGVNTFCPACGALTIERLGGRVKSLGKQRGTCPSCNTNLPGIWC